MGNAQTACLCGQKSVHSNKCAMLKKVVYMHMGACVFNMGNLLIHSTCYFSCSAIVEIPTNDHINNSDVVNYFMIISQIMQMYFMQMLHKLHVYAGKQCP